MANNDLDKIAKAFSNSNKTTSKKTSNSSNGKNYWGKNYYKNPDLVNKISSVKTSAKSSSISKTVSKSANSTINETISNTISNNTNLSSSQTSAVTKQINKLSLKSKICIVILFLLGVVVSIGACFFVCRNDQFEIIGKKNITINVNETYTDLGVNAIGFGINMQDQVSIEVYKTYNDEDYVIPEGLSGIDTSEPCVYQIVYKLSNFRFRDAQIIRIVNIITPIEEEPEDSYTPDETIPDHTPLEPIPDDNPTTSNPDDEIIITENFNNIIFPFKR